MSDTVEEGNYVVLMKSFDSGNMKFVQANKDSVVHYGKLHFDTTPLIGSKFGSVFEIRDNLMVGVANFEAYDSELSSAVSENLLTFNEKSQFSKEKIIKKKKKQNYAHVVTVIRPSLMLVNEMLYARDKLGGLRPDALSQILTSANIQNGSKVLLLDHNLGLLTGAVMTRSLPDGTCIQLVPDNEAISTTRKTLTMLNLSEKDCADKLVAITVRDIYKVHKGTDSFACENDILRAREEEHLQRLSKLDNRAVRDVASGEKMIVEQDESEKKDLHQTLIRKGTNRELRNGERIKAAALLKSCSLDSIIIIAQHDHPLPLIKLSYSFLAPSSQFVIYSDTVEPLLECYQYLKSNSLAVSLSLSETWLRRYQVLPDRTRPEMNISGYGGYLLSGTKALYSSTKTEIGSGIQISESLAQELSGP